MTAVVPEALWTTLQATLGARAHVHEPLARHTSYRVGGPADVLVVPDTAEELATVVREATRHGVPLSLLGGGSNMLVGDRGIRGLVVKLGRGFRHVAWQPTGVRAGAGVSIGQLARSSARRGLAGLEYAEGIPGTVGGAVSMNAGAYGGEIATVCEAVDGVTANGTRERLTRADLPFAYRRAALPPGYVVTQVTFRLQPEAPEVVAARLERLRAQRTASQPHGEPNAGSIFKNPAGDHAGRLIEVAGLKGTRVGGARISERHANFIVNDGTARAADVQTVMAIAQRVVWERSGVWLEPEVRLIGAW